MSKTEVLEKLNELEKAVDAISDTELASLVNKAACWRTYGEEYDHLCKTVLDPSTQFHIHSPEFLRQT